MSKRINLALVIFGLFATLFPLLPKEVAAISLVDSSSFSAEVFTDLGTGRLAHALVFTPDGATAYPYFVYIASHNGATLGNNLYGVSAAGNIEVVRPAMADLMFLEFGPPSFGNSLFGADVGLPESLPDGIYRVSAAGDVVAFNLMDGGNPNPNDIIFSGGGSFGDYLYVASPDDLPGGTLYDSGIIRLDSSGAYAGRLLTLAAGPYKMTLSRGGDFGTFIYFSCLSSNWIYRAAPDGTAQQFAQLPFAGAYCLAFGLGGAFGYDLYVCSNQDAEIRRISASGVVSSFAFDISSLVMAFDPVSHDLFVTDLNSDTLFRVRDTTITTGITDDHAILNPIEVFPNPSSCMTSIRFETAKYGLVQADIFDVLGRRIRVLTDHEFTAGNHDVLWDGFDERGHAVPAGVYLVRVSTAEGPKTKRIVMVR